MFSRRYRMDADSQRPAAAFLLGVAFLIGTAPSAASADPPQCTARFITPGINAINASAMNEAGDVVGTSTSGTGAWVLYAGSPAVFLPLPPGALYSVANDINDAGVVVGSVGVFADRGYQRAAAWTPDGSGGYTIREFGTLPGNIYSDASAVNNVGDIVGYSRDGTFRYPVLFSAPGGIQNLTSTGVFDPKDINDHRVLVDAYARRLDLNTMIVEYLGLPGPNYRSSTGEAINESGQVAGSVILTTGTNCDHQAARYTNRIGWEVLSGCGQANSAWDMNDLGDVVMRLNVAPYVDFQGIGTVLIEDLIVADTGHWYVINGYGLTINNSRQMAVPATNSVTNESGIILITPGRGCPADFNADGSVNPDDLADFITCFFLDIQFPASCPQSDFNADTFRDPDDLSDFITAFFTSAC